MFSDAQLSAAPGVYCLDPLQVPDPEQEGGILPDQVPLAWTAEPVPTNVPSQLITVPFEVRPNVAEPELETVPTTGPPALLEI